MIRPTKHLNFSQSLLGFGAYILSCLTKPKSIDELWFRYVKDHQEGTYIGKHDFDNLVKSLLFLYSVGAIVENDGVVSKCA